MRTSFLALATTAVVFGRVLWPSPVLSHNPTTTTVLFNREIAGIVRDKCAACHGDGLMAMPLDTYAQARPWAVAIKEEVLARRMPPWPAQRGYGEFGNDSSLTTRELDFLLSWIEGGAPSGDGDAPPRVDHRGHWMMGEPDVVLTPAAGTRIPAAQGVRTVRILLDPKTVGDRWVRALDFMPGDPRVVRAAFFSVASTGEYLGGWTPTSAARALPDGVALRLPARSSIALDVVYRGVSQDVDDRPRLALYFRAQAPTSPVSNIVVRAQAERGDAVAGRLRGSVVMSTARSVVALRPEVPRGVRSLEVKATRPDGSSEVLLWIRDYAHDWPTPFVFRQPVELPAGSRVSMTARLASTPPAAGAVGSTVNLTMATVEGRLTAPGAAEHRH